MRKSHWFSAAATLGGLSLGLAAAPASAGCLTGAAVGGVAGHMAHHHALVGAAAGCVVGHGMAARKKRETADQKAAERRQAQQPQPAPTRGRPGG
ncbi:MAG TPA: hypothetical protein VMU59_03060 [Caulobacteraceae bacterium]|nr:hypothetical protein [Caulobacteraceae bacterium]